MAASPLYSAEQITFIKRAYLRDGTKTGQLASLVNSKYASSYTGLQMQNLVRDRGWTVMRGSMKARIPDTNTLLIQAERQCLADIKEDAEAFLKQCAQAGQDALNKAHAFIGSATSAKTLGSAIGAARIAIGIKRQAIGLDSLGGNSSPSHFQFNFASIAAPLFATKAAELISS